MQIQCLTIAIFSMLCLCERQLSTRFYQKSSATNVEFIQPSQKQTKRAFHQNVVIYPSIMFHPILSRLSNFTILNNNYEDGKLIVDDKVNSVPSQLNNSPNITTKNTSDVDSHSNPETHIIPVNVNSSQTGSIDNSIAVEYLPTITVPFLDNFGHGIMGGLHQHVQIVKPDIILLGTKWCGDGNKARSYEDVGVLYKTDKCCRNHDKCPYYILAHETKYSLHNDAHFTRSHCDCDASFYNCLKNVNSPFSTGVGITYFNILKIKCFKLEYPVVACSQMAGWFSKHCVEYIVDVNKQKQWQWFDNHEF